MNRRYEVSIIALVTMLLLLNVPVSIVPVSAQPREDIIWGAGYWPGLGNFNPVRMDEGMGWDTYTAYEPMLGTDVASGQVFGWLAAKKPEWDPTGTVLTIKLRSGAYWVKIADWDGWLAETYTPEKYRDITAEDVVFSYYLTGACPESPAPAGFMDAIATRADTSYTATIGGITMSGFEIVDATTIKLHLTPTYANSEIVWRVMTRSYLMVPFDIWLQIDPDPATPNAEGSYEYFDFTNDWTAEDFNPDWRVASGMYLPWKHILAAADRWKTIIKKNENWWGITVLGRQPAPGYMGYYVGYTNEEVEVMIKDGLIDWDGNYVPGYPWSEAPYLHTYFADPPYFPDKSALLMTPNYRKWPISESWLHWAIAYIMDYPANSIASSGYCVDGSKYSIYGTEIQYPNAFLIPKDDAIANTYLADYPNKNNYLVGNQFHTVDEAIALLEQYCYYIVDGSIGDFAIDKPAGDWYTKGDDIAAIKAWADNLWSYFRDKPECNWFNPDPPLVIGVVKKLASEWLDAIEPFETLVLEADQLPAIDGINVMLGYSDYPNVGDPWTIIDVAGWTDVNAIDVIAAQSINDDLDIPFGARFISWDAYQDWVSGEGQTYVYDFMDYCMQWGINGDLYERYTQLFTCWSGVWNHYNGYANQDLEDLIESLDIVADPQAVANQIFDIVGTDLPYIPMSGHPDWYVYSKQYWRRWPNEKHEFLAASPYGGASQGANLHYILLCLGPLVVPMKPGLTPAPTDLNNDGKVNIKDISLAARAFGSYPGHPRWEFVADIMPEQGDGKVNILDIGRIALDFGATETM